MNRRDMRYAGFTLAEVAISVAVVGLLMGGALELQTRVHRQQQVGITYDNIDAITDALSIYVASSGRLPCPADPAAMDIVVGKERARCDVKTRIGIVPYKTLGLTREQALDGWGRYYTYGVSPVFARMNDQTSAAADTGKVDGRCRHPGWVNSADRYNRNAIKARFCCADQMTPTFDNDSDLIVLHTSGGTALSPVRTPGTSSAYDDLTKTTTYKKDGADVPFMDTSPVEAPAFVLVSHGADGRGSWLGNGTNNRYDTPDSGPELTNTGDNGIFVDGPWNLKLGPDYYDDIVRWMTQDGIMAAHGTLSCSYP